MRHTARPLILLSMVVTLAACASAPTTVRPTENQAAGENQAGGSSDPSANLNSRKTLVLVGRSEAPSLSSKPLQSLGLTNSTGPRLFNAGLSLMDGRGTSLPYLAEALPRLNTDSWRVFPDGRMETTYRLHSGFYEWKWTQ